MTYYDNDALASVIAPDPDGTGSLGVLETTYIYDDLGRQTQTILPDANSIYTVYNEKGQVEKTYGSQQNPVEYTYDYAGRQKTMTTWQDFNESTGVGISGAAETTWIYNPQRGWLDRKEYDDGNGTTYTYTPGGRLASRTWERGVTTNYAYNSAGDLLAVDYDDSGVTPDIHYTYTRTGQQDIVSEGQYATAAFIAGDSFTPSLAPTLLTVERSTDYDYNARFQVETETISGLLTSDAVLTRIYEDGTETNGLIGRAEGYSFAGGTTSVSSATYGYETTSRLQTVTDGTDTFTYAYEPNSNLLASLTAPQHTVDYSYEPNRNAMTVIDNKLSRATTSLSTYTYTYDSIGRRADSEQSGTAFSQTNKDTFAYNTRSEVEGSTNDLTTAAEFNPTYTYDQIGNRKTSVGEGSSLDPLSPTTYTANELL